MNAKKIGKLSERRPIQRAWLDFLDPTMVPTQEEWILSLVKK
jgi:hypothetical protein